MPQQPGGGPARPAREEAARRRGRAARRLAVPLLLASLVLAGCAGPSDTPNPACDKKWKTAISMARCLLGIQPPPETGPASGPAATSPAAPLPAEPSPGY